MDFKKTVSFPTFFPIHMFRIDRFLTVNSVVAVLEHPEALLRQVPLFHDVVDEGSVIQFWVQKQQPGIILASPIHATAREMLVLKIPECRVSPLYFRPNVDVTLIVRLEPANLLDRAPW
ncbi:hypothetical protein ACG873_23195 [Mesorhizobium sp. AaZ16]